MVDMAGRLKHHHTVAFFLLAFVFCWAFWVPRAVLSHIPGIPAVVLMALQMIGVFGPCAAAVLLSARAEGRVGVRNLFAPYRRWKIGAGWYAFVIAYRPLIWLAALALYLALGIQRPAAAPVDWLFFAAYFVTQPLLVGVGEELGWMGFAYPRLRARFGFLSGTLLLGVLWALWHLPMFYTIGDSQYGASLILFAVKLTAFRLVMAVVFEATGSLLMPALFHVSMNALSELVPLSPNDPLATGLAIAISLGVGIAFMAQRQKGQAEALPEGL